MNSERSVLHLRLDNERASIFILTMWALFLLTALALQVGIIVRQKITLAKRLDDRDKLFFIAQAGVNKAISVLRKSDEMEDADALFEDWSTNDDTFKDIPIGDGQFSVRYTDIGEDGPQTRFGMQDESTKINLNKASVDVLTRLLEIRAGLDEDTAVPLAYAIIDWRDADSEYQHPEYGAEDSDYEHLKHPYEAKDADYETIYELMLVKGMTEDIFAKIKDYVTVFGDGTINVNTVSGIVLKALGLGEQATSALLTYRKGGDLVEGTVDDGVFTSTGDVIDRISQNNLLPAPDQNLLARWIDEGTMVVTTDYYMIRSVARLNGKSTEMNIAAVVSRDGRIFYWKESF